MNSQDTQDAPPPNLAVPPARDPEAVVNSLRQIFRQDRSTTDHTEALRRLEHMVRSMASDGTRRDEPMREVFARLGDKWSTLLMHLLRTGNYRHALLRRLVSTVGIEGRISQRMLTLRLRSLERDGLIGRRVIETHPPGVEYVLTPLGHELTQRIEDLMQWIRENLQQIRNAREQFDQAAAAETRLSKS